MDQKLLRLRPTRFLCPYCGEWHNWDKDHALEFYDSKHFSARFECANGTSGYYNGNYKIYFYDGCCYYSTSAICGRANQAITGKIPISSIIESTDKTTVTFAVPFTAKYDVGSVECSECNFEDECIYCELGDEGDKRHMTITFGFEFDQSEILALARKEKQQQEREAAVANKEQVSQRPQVKENKEDTVMANNIFNMNMDFGLNKDENIVSTLMGVAVKNGDSWRIYDKKKKEIIDVGDMQLGNLPIFILPTTKISEGDLIKDAGEYYFVTKVATPKAPTQTLSARNGEMKNVVPIKNLLGFSCYSKVIALSDLLDIGENFDMEKLAIMSAMCGQNGEKGGQMNELILMMLFNDKLGGDDDIMKLMIMSPMMTSKDDSGQMNQLVPLMLFNDKLGGKDDMIKRMLMFSMMGGNQAGSNNQMMNYLSLYLLMDKKDEKATKAGDGAAE